MSSTENTSTAEEQDPNQNRPDPAFKYLTRQIAIHYGLQTIETEFPQTLRADLVLGVPEGLNLAETLFDFFRRLNVIEFKGENDLLDEYEFAKTEIRTTLLFIQQRPIEIENILNVIVSSRLPRRFFNYMREHGCRFRRVTDKPWLWHSRVGLQDVFVVVCVDLPLDQRYFDWLVFAPAGTRKWRSFLRLLIAEHNWSLLETLRRLRPKEYENMQIQIDEILAAYSPEEQAQYLADLAYALKRSLPRLAKRNPELLSDVFSDLDSQELLTGLSPEQRQKLLKLLLEQEQKPE